LPYEFKFSDVFPRIITSFKPDEFRDSSKFITEFINLETNPLAEMIIDVEKIYPEIKVEETQWYILNNEITTEIEELRSQLELMKKKLDTIANK